MDRSSRSPQLVQGLLKLWKPGAGLLNFVEKAVIFVMMPGALLLLGFVLAYWTWVWLGPRTGPRSEAAAHPGLYVESAYGLFGSVQQAGEEGAAPTGVAVKLLGVVAASHGRRGYAVVQFDSRRIVVAGEGDDVAPGVRLVKVYPDHAVLERNGVRETLAWPKKNSSPSPSIKSGNK